MEQPAVIPKSHAVSRQVQRGQRIKETGCKPSKPSVSKTRLRLCLLKLRHGLPVLLQDFIHFLIHTKVNQIIAQKFSN